MSGEWLLEGRGTPDTRTGTLSLPRIVSAEERLTKLENLVNQNVGYAQVKQMFAQKDERVFENPNGTFGMYRATNSQLRLDCDNLKLLVDQLSNRVKMTENLLAAQTELIKSYTEQTDAVKALAVALS